MTEVNNNYDRPTELNIDDASRFTGINLSSVIDGIINQPASPVDQRIQPFAETRTLNAADDATLLVVNNTITNEAKLVLANKIISGFTDVITQTVPLNFSNFNEAKALNVRDFLANFLTPEQISRLPDAVLNISVENFLKNFDALKPFIPAGELNAIVGDSLARVFPGMDFSRLDPAYSSMTMEGLIRTFAGLLPTAVQEYPPAPTPVADPGLAPLAPVAPVAPLVPVAPIAPAVVADPGLRPSLPVVPVAPVAPGPAPVPVANPGPAPEAPVPVLPYSPARITIGGVDGTAILTASLEGANDLLLNATDAYLASFGTSRALLKLKIDAYPAEEAIRRANYNGSFESRNLKYDAELVAYNNYNANLAAYTAYTQLLATYNAEVANYNTVSLPAYNAALTKYDADVVAYNTYDSRVTAFNNYQIALATFAVDNTKYQADLATYQADTARYQAALTQYSVDLSLYQTVTLPQYNADKTKYDQYVIDLAAYKKLYPDAPIT